MNSKLNCICCSKTIETEPFTESAIQGKLMAGYGSIHDGLVVQITICDECLITKLANGSAIETGNYFAELQKEPKGAMITEETNQSIYKRLMD
jgi:hypothetical protein